jgi:hypothetical protein
MNQGLSTEAENLQMQMLAKLGLLAFIAEVLPPKAEVGFVLLMSDG